MLVANDVLTLSSCVHAAMAMLYPFAWQHVFIPLLPADMLEYASAPMPFVIGVRTSMEPSRNGVEGVRARGMGSMLGLRVPRRAEQRV